MSRTIAGGGVCLAALIAGGARGGDAPPLLAINWSVNGGPLNEILVSTTGGGEGELVYEGELVDAGTGLELSYSIEADPAAAIDGNLTISNGLGDRIEVFAEVILPFADDLPAGSELQGTAAVGLTTGPGGGALASVEPIWVWQALVDGAAAGADASLFAHPFELTASGIGSAAVFADFGMLAPVAGPPVAESIGFRVSFSVTSSATASVSGQLTVAGCPNDLTGDGAVNIADFTTLLSAWGPCPIGCPADFDGNGAVDIVDLLELLASWGTCS